jgi:hypothetical protein
MWPMFDDQRHASETRNAALADNQHFTAFLSALKIWLDKTNLKDIFAPGNDTGTNKQMREFIRNLLRAPKTGEDFHEQLQSRSSYIKNMLWISIAKVITREKRQFSARIAKERILKRTMLRIMFKRDMIKRMRALRNVRRMNQMAANQSVITERLCVLLAGESSKSTSDLFQLYSAAKMTLANLRFDRAREIFDVHLEQQEEYIHYLRAKGGGLPEPEKIKTKKLLKRIKSRLKKWSHKREQFEMTTQDLPPLNEMHQAQIAIAGDNHGFRRMICIRISGAEHALRDMEAANAARIEAIEARYQPLIEHASQIEAANRAALETAIGEIPAANDEIVPAQPALPEQARLHQPAANKPTISEPPLGATLLQSNPCR